MNKILYLFDEKYVKKFFEKDVLPLYPDFVGIKDIEIIGHKKNIWEDTYHVVVEFNTTFLTREGVEKKLHIYCSAHSDEPRKNVYDALRFLWDHGFRRGDFSIPHPLFYSDYFQGTFYRGVEGRNLYRYIRDKNYSEIEDIIPKAAEWFVKLHGLNTDNARNFNKENSRIETVIPGIDHILKRIKERYPKYSEIYEEIYGIVDSSEKEYLASTDQRWFVHGDAHPENIIKMGRKKIAIIDFTDICLSDFTRDIGAFLQQLEYMIKRKIKDAKFSDKMKNVFLKSYFNLSPIKLDESVKKRIDNYYYWTAMRTATYFLIKDKSEPERSYPLICQVCRGLEVQASYKGICEKY